MMRWLAVLLVIGAARPVAAGPTMVSVKVVKATASRCATPPTLEWVTDADQWRLVTRPWHCGENDWEAFFEMETDAPAMPLSEVAVTVPGVKAARVIVGKTDVPFTREGDRVRFRLVKDTAPGQQMQVVYRSPRGGYPIHFLHNWEMRKAWGYAEGEYPAKQVAAVKNYLLAAHEVLRVMGDMGPGEPKRFRGEICLMDSEVAASRGHMDHPSHVHIMFYQFEKNAEGKTEWVSRLVPHFYMDGEGRIVRNSYAVLAGRGKSGDLRAGDVCRFEDTGGNHVLDLVITADGLEMRRPDGVTYSLRPDPEKGAAHAVYGYRGDTPICRVEARDDAAAGRFEYRVETLRDGQVAETFRDGYRYDPFTAKVLGKWQSQP